MLSTVCVQPLESWSPLRSLHFDSAWADAQQRVVEKKIVAAVMRVLGLTEQKVLQKSIKSGAQHECAQISHAEETWNVLNRWKVEEKEAISWGKLYTWTNKVNFFFRIICVFIFKIKVDFLPFLFNIFQSNNEEKAAFKWGVFDGRVGRLFPKTDSNIITFHLLVLCSGS